jgi:hypothetical protein
LFDFFSPLFPVAFPGFYRNEIYCILQNVTKCFLTPLTGGKREEEKVMSCFPSLLDSKIFRLGSGETSKISCERYPLEKISWKRVAADKNIVYL